MNPRIVFCTTCKGRAEHLTETLPRNMADNADYENCKFVVLDYCDPGPLRAFLWSRHKQDMRSGRLAVYSFMGHESGETTDPDPVLSVLSNRVPPPNIPFHMAHAKNMAARCGILEGADILVTLDADNLTGPGFARYVSEQMSGSGLCTFMCPDFPAINSMPHGPDRPARGYAGRLAIRAQDFLKAGGYDEIYDTWRGEDMDLIYRLRRIGYAERHIENRFLNALRHGSEVRFREYPPAQCYETPDYIKVIASRTERVVNYGRLGLGTVFRNFSPVPVNLSSLPTRVFGLGMHRTATTSLHRAFQVLGFDSFHFNDGLQARMIWEEMQSREGSPVLEKWYALCDLPIPLLYRRLDTDYPGSKFILTVRDESRWLASVERLWSYEHNPLRWTWDKWPFSHLIHTALYGRSDFDAETFLRRYRAHNDEVAQYFRNRPDDLLVMDMDMDNDTRTDKWPALCSFLNVPVPAVPYPNESHMKKASPEK